MEFEEFKKLVNELFDGNIILTDDVGYVVYGKVYTLNGIELYTGFREGTKVELGQVVVNGRKVLSIGFTSKGVPAIYTTDYVVSKLNEKEVLRILSVVPLVFIEFASKLSVDDSDYLKGIIGELTRNKDEPIDDLKPFKRVLKRMVRNVNVPINGGLYVRGFNDALKTYSKLLKEGWVLTSRKGEAELYYDGVIYVDVIRFRGAFYPIPDHLKGKLYVKGVHVPLRERIELVYVDEAVHPNVNDNKTFCLGDANNVPLTDIMTVISLIRTANLDSAYPNKGQMIAETILNEILGLGDDEEEEDRTIAFTFNG